MSDQYYNGVFCPHRITGTVQSEEQTMFRKTGRDIANMIRRWSPQEDQLILQNHGKLKAVELAKLLDRSTQAVQARYSLLTKPPASPADVENIEEKKR